MVLSGSGDGDVILPPMGHFTMSGDVFHCHNWEGAIGISWVEAREAAKRLSMHRTASTTKDYLVQNVNRTGVEKLFWQRIRLNNCKIKSLAFTLAVGYYFVC